MTTISPKSNHYLTSNPRLPLASCLPVGHDRGQWQGAKIKWFHGWSLCHPLLNNTVQSHHQKKIICGHDASSFVWLLVEAPILRVKPQIAPSLLNQVVSIWIHVLIRKKKHFLDGKSTFLMGNHQHFGYLNPNLGGWHHITSQFWLVQFQCQLVNWWPNSSFVPPFLVLQLPPFLLVTLPFNSHRPCLIGGLDSVGWSLSIKFGVFFLGTVRNQTWQWKSLIYWFL